MKNWKCTRCHKEIEDIHERCYCLDSPVPLEPINTAGDGAKGFFENLFVNSILGKMCLKPIPKDSLKIFESKVKTKKTKPVSCPEFTSPDICRYVYSNYLVGKSVEMIVVQSLHDGRFLEGGEFEGVQLTEREINDIIDFYNELEEI